MDAEWYPAVGRRFPLAATRIDDQPWQVGRSAPMSNKEKIFVTGASGFVGSAVARKLVEAGFSVRALVRRKSPRAHLAGLDLDFFEGDLRDPQSIERPIAGMRYVFHVAADYRLWARDPGEIFASNVEGTRNLMEEAMRAGVERVIYTSSVATIARATGRHGR